MRRAILDFSGLWWTNWHATADAELSAAADRTLSTVHQLARDYDALVVALDSMTSWRRRVYPATTDPDTGEVKGYKAQREPHAPQAIEQMMRLRQTLRDDGLVLYGANDHEGDDVIAAVSYRARMAGEDLDIIGVDKDLWQCLHAGVRLVSWDTRREPRDAAWLLERYDITPAQVPLWQALQGDSSDNIPGVQSVGPKTATRLVTLHSSGGALRAETVTHLQDTLDLVQVSDRIRQRVQEAIDSKQLDLWLRLTTLEIRTPLPADLWAQPTTTTETETETTEDTMHEIPPPNDTIPSQRHPSAPPSQPASEPSRTPQPDSEPTSSAPRPHRAEIAMVASDGASSGWSADWSQALEPATLSDAVTLSKWANQSRLFGGYGRAEAVLMVIMAGRELGLGAMASLRSFHVVKGRPVMAAQAMMALCLRHPDCAEFRVLRSRCSETEAWVSVRRRGWSEPELYSWTQQDAKRAGLLGKDGNHDKYPRQMLINRCIAEAARFAFPDIVGGMYCPEDLQGVAA